MRKLVFLLFIRNLAEMLLLTYRFRVILIIYIQKGDENDQPFKQRYFRLLEVLSKVQTQALSNNQKMQRDSLHKMLAVP